MSSVLIIIAVFGVLLIAAGFAWKFYDTRQIGSLKKIQPQPTIILVTGEFGPSMAYLNIKGINKSHYVRDNAALHGYRGPGVELHFVGPLRNVDMAIMRYANSRDIKVKTIPEPRDELRPIEKGPDTWD